MPAVRSLKVSTQEPDLEPSSIADNATRRGAYRGTSTAKRSRATKPKKDTVRKKKPSNAFFLFRSHIIANKLIPRGSHQNDVSIGVARLWRESSEETRRHFFRKAEMEKERYDAEVCGSGLSVEFSEASTSGSVWSVTSPRAHQQDSTRCPTPVLSPPAPPTPESSSCPDLPQHAPFEHTGEEKILPYNVDPFCWAPKMHTKPLPHTSTIYPAEVEIAPGLFPVANPPLNLSLSEFDWSADMLSSELTPHPQYFVSQTDLTNTLDCWFPYNSCMPFSSFP